MTNAMQQGRLKRHRRRVIAQADPDGTFWKFCQRASAAAQSRAKEFGVPCSINKYDIDELMRKQGYFCAVSGMPLDKPGNPRGPFGPSVDRIQPALGYVPGNVRVVCNIVNLAMSNWGEEALLRLVEGMWLLKHVRKNLRAAAASIIETVDRAA